jgi:hypothetical protein
VGCLAGDLVSKINDQLDKLYDALPEPLKWLILSKKIEEIVREKLEPEVRKAAGRLAEFARDRSTLADVILLLARSDYATKDRLNQIFAEDRSGRSLLTFSDFSMLIDRDMALAGGVFSADGFPALAHSITLAKLSMLGEAELNRLIRDLSDGYVSEIYGRDVYSFRYENMTILHDMVRSLDGNHQWQAYGLPRPRRGPPVETPAELPFGRNGYADRAVGLRIWTDPGLRQRVFSQLFPTAIIGSLGERGELQHPIYPYPACPPNRFPTTQTRTGDLQAADLSCAL